MKVTVKESAPKMLERFLGYLMKRVEDPIYENDRDLIADFVEKFLVVEMKQPDTQTPFDHDVDVPDDVYKKPLELAQKQLEAYRTLLDKVLHAQETIAKDARDFLKRGITQDIPSLDSATAQINRIDQGLTTLAEQEATTAPSAKRNGNGHKSQKVRDLNGTEKDIIRACFLELNGQIDDDSCLPIKQRLAPEISIFQVTGFVTWLHTSIASGRLEVKDMPKYLEFIQTHRDLWATYNSPKYMALRAKSGKV